MVDYGAGNLHSVRRAIEAAGGEPLVTADPRVLATTDGIVLPGVGSARSAMDTLDRAGISDLLREHAASGRPLLGVCLGLQLFFGENEEGPTTGLGLLPGRVARLRNRSKVPHMGWNSLDLCSQSPLLRDVPAGSYVYFVHSYHVLPESERDVVAATDYEGPLVAVAGRGSVLGTQFHPEKSGLVGLAIYRNFVGMVGG